MRKTLPIAILLISYTIAFAIPAAHNEAILKGTVTEYCLSLSSLSGIKPEMVLNKLVITVDEVEDVKGPNFLKIKKGYSGTFYSKETLPVELFGKKVKAVIEYVGDEKGGRFWINKIELLE